MSAPALSSRSPRSLGIAPTAPSSAPWRGSFPARTTLTTGDRRVVRAIAEAMFAQDGEVEAARLDAHLDDVDGFVSAASKPVRTGLRIALFLVRIAPILLFVRLCTLERLPIDERVAVLTRLERSRLAELSLAFIGWRTIMTLVFYEHPGELAALGYAGDERQVYKRRLPTLMVLGPAPAAPSLTRSAPPADESGVRLRAEREDLHEPDADDSGEHKVA